MCAACNDDRSKRLGAPAAAAGRSKQEVIGRAVAARGARHSQEESLADTIGRALPRYHGLLDRMSAAEAAS